MSYAALETTRLPVLQLVREVPSSGVEQQAPEFGSLPLSSARLQISGTRPSFHSHVFEGL